MHQDPVFAAHLAIEKLLPQFAALGPRGEFLDGTQKSVVSENLDRNVEFVLPTLEPRKDTKLAGMGGDSPLGANASTMRLPSPPGDPVLSAPSSREW